MNRRAAVRARGDLAAYALLAVTTTGAAVVGRERTHLVSKLLLAPTLAAGVVATRHQRPLARSATLVVALAGSTVGDWWMNASGHQSDPARRRELMRRGATAFAVQQIGLVRLLVSDGVRPRALPTSVVGGVLATLAVVDAGPRGGTPDPVLSGYGLLLGTMAALATSDATAPRHRRSVGLGGALFLMSDATIVLADHMATSARQRALVSGAILSTYAAGLALLVHGLCDGSRAGHAPATPGGRPPSMARHQWTKGVLSSTVACRGMHTTLL